MSEEDLKNMTVRIQTVINKDRNNGSKEQCFQPGSMSSLKIYFQRKYPKESEEKIMVKGLDHMKNQFLSAFPNQRAKDDDSMKTVSSHGSLDSINSFNCLAGEAQPEPTQEDIWDSLIEAISQQAKASEKGKSPAKD